MTPYFPPERGAPQRRWGELVELLAAEGFGVEVLTHVPHYPSGRTYPGHRWVPLRREPQPGWTVWRVGNIQAATAGFWPRLVDQVSSGVVLAAAVLVRPRSDWVICETPPVFTALAAGAARLRGSRYALYVADLWPESAVDLETIARGGLIETLMRRLVDRTYRQASLIFTTSETQRLRCQLFTTAPCLTLPSSVDLRRFPPGDGAAPPSGGSPAGLRLAYTGTLGLAHGLDFLIEAAGGFPAGVGVVLVGDGSERARLAELARRLGGRVEVVRPIPPEEVPGFLAAVDVGVVALRDVPTFRGISPDRDHSWARRRGRCRRGAAAPHSGPRARPSRPSTSPAGP